MHHYGLNFNKGRGIFAIAFFSLMGFFQLVVYSNLYYLGDLSGNIFVFLGNFIFLFIGYIFAIYFYRVGRLKEKFPSLLPTLLFLFSISFRAIMVISETYLSTDILRYLWDGMLLSEGVDPYRYVPSSAELNRFKDVEYYEVYDHKNEFTIYPPLAQLFFAVNYFLFENDSLGLKSILSIFDIFNGILIILITYRIMGNHFQAYHGALIYLWNPLVILEFSNSGHMDALAIFLMFFSIYLLSKTSIISSLAILVMSALTKWIPLLMIPFWIKFFLKKRLMRHSLGRALFFSTLITTILILPFYLSSGFYFLMGMMDFIKNWRFESALSRFLIFLLPFEGSREIQIVKMMSYLIFIASYLLILLHSRLSNDMDLISHLILIQILFYLISPATFPWYTLWLLALVSLTRIGLMTWASVTLTGIAVVNYLQEFSTLSGFQFWMAYSIWFIPIVAIILFYLSKSNAIRGFIRIKNKLKV